MKIMLLASAINFLAVGDSITTGFNANKAFRDARDYSWATGEKINSHATRLKENHEVTVDNLAVAGSTIDGVMTQIDSYLNQGKIPDYVTFSVGANDLCHADFDIDKFEDSLWSAVSMIKLENENAKIVLLAVPNIVEAYNLVKHERFCRVMWQKFNVCHRLVTEEPSKTLTQWHDINKAIGNVASEFNDVRVTSEGSMKREHISDYDCFHPSAAGQEEIARVSWEE